jgi:hypothetical protein
VDEQEEIYWHGRMVGIDLNPEGIGWPVASRDGNLIAMGFFKDNCLFGIEEQEKMSSGKPGQ